MVCDEKQKESEKGRQVNRGEVRLQKPSALKSPHMANTTIAITRTNPNLSKKITHVVEAYLVLSIKAV